MGVPAERDDDHLAVRLHRHVLGDNALRAERRGGQTVVEERRVDVAGMAEELARLERFEERIVAVHAKVSRLSLGWCL
jgi:hypothetical protein